MKKIILVIGLFTLIPAIGFSQDKDQDQVDHDFICKILQEKSSQKLLPVYTVLTREEFEKQFEDNNSVKGGDFKEGDDITKSYQKHLTDVASSNAIANKSNSPVFQAQGVQKRFCTSLSEQIVQDKVTKGLQADQ